jgi:CheY-like chemotaxis protein
VTRQRSILVVDDELGIRDLFRFALEPLGFEVTTAQDGVEAIEWLRHRAFDLVLLDIHMPNMGGPETFARARELRPTQKVLVVTSSIAALHPFEAGLSSIECVFKPLELDELTRAVERALDDTGETDFGGST